MVEAAGIEPASHDPSIEASTHVVNLLSVSPDRLRLTGSESGQPVCSPRGEFTACDVAALWRLHLLHSSPYVGPQVLTRAGVAGLLRQPLRMPVCYRHVWFCQVFYEAS